MGVFTKAEQRRAVGSAHDLVWGRVKPRVLTPIPVILTEARRTPMIRNDSRTMPRVKWHFFLFLSKNKNSHLRFVNTILNAKHYVFQ